MRLENRHVLLTGASGGLGRAIALDLAARGAAVAVTGRRVEQLERLAAEIGGRALVADLADPEDLERLVAAAGPVDVLVANAGLGASGPLTGLDVAAVDRALAVNLRAPMVLTQALVPGMIDRGGGHVVFVSSLAGKVATAGMSLYAATKFGLRGFAIGLREDLRQHGVGVSCVFPGFIRNAGMFHDSGARLPGYVGTRTPADVSAAVVRAIEQNRAEIDVASPQMRLLAVLAGVNPEALAGLQRGIGAHAAASMAERHHE